MARSDWLAFVWGFVLCFEITSWCMWRFGRIMAGNLWKIQKRVNKILTTLCFTIVYWSQIKIVLICKKQICEKVGILVLCFLPLYLYSRGSYVCYVIAKWKYLGETTTRPSSQSRSAECRSVLRVNIACPHHSLPRVRPPVEAMSAEEAFAVSFMSWVSVAEHHIKRWQRRCKAWENCTLEW